jgi:hypothetical protein
MNTETMHARVSSTRAPLLLAFALLWSGSLLAQVPVDEDGNPLDAVDLEATGGEPLDESAAGETGASAVDEVPPMTPEDLEALVGPIALYPDKLLAIVLPASTYPLEIVQAARFLEQLEDDSSLKPDDTWDDSVTALLNYPEVLRMMNEDIDWTWRLGEAVVRQQPDVIAAVETFRDKAYAAGNLKTDERQRVSNDDGVIAIEPLEEDIIYVPYYEPERVVHYQPRQVYYYYPRPYPVYYYPYPAHHAFHAGYFWGVTTAFRIGWATDHLHVFHHSYWGHPYYGRQYFGHWYRRPSITVYNQYYPNSHRYRSEDHHRNGDYWRPRDGGARPGHYRARLERFGERSRASSTEGYRVPDRSGRRTASDSNNNRAGFRGDTGTSARSGETREGFAASRRAQAREREDLARTPRAARPAAGASNDTIRFRPRTRANADGGADRVQPERRQESDTVVRTPERPARPTDPRDGGDTIRFRSRSNQDGATGTRPRVSASPPTPDSTARARAGTDRPAIRDRSNQRASPPEARRAPPTSGFRADPGRSAPAARPGASRPQASPPAARAPTVRAPTVSRPQVTPRTAPAPRANSTPAPRASSPARAPKTASSPRRSSGTSSARTPRTREH